MNPIKNKVQLQNVLLDSMARIDIDMASLAMLENWSNGEVARGYVSLARCPTIAGSTNG